MNMMADEPVDESKAVTFLYRNHRGEISVRRVVPRDLYWAATSYYPEPQWILLAYDLDKKAEREFSWKGMGPQPIVTRQLGGPDDGEA